MEEKNEGCRGTFLASRLSANKRGRAGRREQVASCRALLPSACPARALFRGNNAPSPPCPALDWTHRRETVYQPLQTKPSLLAFSLAGRGVCGSLSLYPNGSPYKVSFSFEHAKQSSSNGGGGGLTRAAWIYCNNLFPAHFLSGRQKHSMQLCKLDIA